MYKLFGSAWAVRWALVGALLLLMVGCSFGGGAAEEFEMMSFEDEGEAGVSEDAAVEQPMVHDVSVRPLVLEELNYLLSHQAWLESLRQLNRDMVRMIEESDEDEAGLPWVVDVHEVTRESDDVFALVLGVEIPATQAPAHFEIYLSALQTVQVMAYGSDRLLASALVVGPSGRLVGDLGIEDEVRFKTYSREASFFLRDAERLLEDDFERVSDAIAQVGLR